MISTKVKIALFLLLISVFIQFSEVDGFKGFLKKIKNTIKRVGKEVGRSTKKVVKEIGRGGKKINKFVVNKVAKNVLKTLNVPALLVMKSTLKLKKLISKLKKSKEVKIVESPESVPETPPPQKAETFDAAMTRLHNQMRNENGVSQALTWDLNMVKEAQAWAVNCAPEYKVFGDKRDESYGQNVFPLQQGQATAEGAIATWNSFKDMYDAGKRECKGDENCYPFLQIIWERSTSFGCSLVSCSGNLSSIVVCFYTPL